MSKYIQNIENNLAKKGIERQTQESREWLRLNMRKISRSKGMRIAEEIRKQTQWRRSLPRIGRMYMFLYIAKGKDELPYWDMFPLIFVVNRYKDGILGINLHYLQPKLRLVLFDALIKIRTNSKYDDTTKIRLTWRFLKSFSKHRLVKPIVKRYLFKQLRTKYIEIPAEDWEIAAFLPTETFRHTTVKQVWRDSKIIASR